MSCTTTAREKVKTMIKTKYKSWELFAAFTFLAAERGATCGKRSFAMISCAQILPQEKKQCSACELHTNLHLIRL